MKTKARKPRHGDTKLVPFEVSSPYGESEIHVFVEWDKQSQQWMMTPSGIKEVESEKARLMLRPETIVVVAGYDPKTSLFSLSITPPCGRGTIIIDDLSLADMNEIRTLTDSIVLDYEKESKRKKKTDTKP